MIDRLKAANAHLIGGKEHHVAIGDAILLIEQQADLIVELQSKILANAIALSAAEQKIENQRAEIVRGLNERNRLWVELGIRQGSYK